MKRRDVLMGAGAATLVGTRAYAQALEKPKMTIAVGGKNLLYYLPLTIAEQKGFFKAEGLDVTIVDFAGGARATGTSNTMHVIFRHIWQIVIHHIR